MRWLAVVGCSQANASCISLQALHEDLLHPRPGNVSLSQPAHGTPIGILSGSTWLPHLCSVLSSPMLQCCWPAGLAHAFPASFEKTHHLMQNEGAPGKGRGNIINLC